MIGEEKKVNDCDYPMCAAAKDATMEQERHVELKGHLERIETNQTKIEGRLQQAVMKLEQIALLSLEMGHLKQDLNGLGDKIRTFETDVWREINAIKQERVTWLQQVIILLLGGGVMGIGGFLLAKLWPYITGGSG